MSQPLLAALQPPPADPILALGSLFAADTRPNKLDLGIGVYKDEAGETPIMLSVKQAERQLLASRTTKRYVGARGDRQFAAAMLDVTFGAATEASRIASLQAPGGTGALRILAQLLAEARPKATVWLPSPTWLNHQAIFAAVGLKTAYYPYYDTEQSTVRFDSLCDRLGSATPGDVVLLHGCCHNPSGADLDEAQWRTLATLFLERDLIPFVDIAYQGFGRGLDEDARGLRILAARLPELLAASSCSKNFGLYSERVGCALVLARNPREAEIAAARMTVHARTIYSMPPDHGAAIVRTILEDVDLLTNWHDELTSIREDMNEKRARLAEAFLQASGSDEFAYLAHGFGMFSLLKLSRAQIEEARAAFGIYIVEDGRINVAGLPVARIDAFVESILTIRKSPH
ncbi:aspartate/tyrosine/aromatic aminotransferase [Sphingomonas sp. H39-1-10]|uniref:amino acid aminotransferase n=1 Tax=Sphingomonas pollutisoli TaxID=3030829 RepID=UPI0023B9B4CA|nr:amino acid aminotransferase [Sphingomonas pollutisoli]MDF0490095.1 aspartate/tyrosine/aromatic aminotransferase [Sphingomonas pollutisoli]